MRWIALAVITVLAVALQTTVAAWMSVGGAGPSFLFIAAIFYGFRRPVVDAGITGWILGMAGDLTSYGPLGAQSLMFALAAMAASQLRSAVNIRSPFAQLGVVGGLCWLSYSIIFGYDAWRNAWTGGMLGGSAVTAAGIAAYTALLTPYLFWLLERILVFFGVPAAKRR